MGVLIQVAQLLLSLCFLILLHELGHFTFARIFKTRVEKFYLFFNPWFSIYKKKIGDTEFGLGWLPIGGYCKIAGMIDESMDKEQMKQPPQPWEFRSKPAWQRLLIISGGVLTNFILALFLYSMVLYVWGKEYLPTENAIYGYAMDSTAQKAGLRDGDMILSVDHKPTKTYLEVPLLIIVDNAKTIQVLRNQEKIDVPVPSWLSEKLTKYEKASFITPRIPFTIDSVNPNSAASQAGLTKGDRIIGLNNEATPYFNEFKNQIQHLLNQDISITVLRKTDTLQLKGHVPETGLLGISGVGMDQYFKLNKQEYTFFQAIPAGIKEGVSTLTGYVSSLKLLFRHEGYKSLGSIISFTRVYSPTWDWHSFFLLTAFLSIILAFMNILPIPALDGGYILFILYEMILRKKPSDKFLEYAQMTGMLLLLALMAYAIFNDINRFIH